MTGQSEKIKEIEENIKEMRNQHIIMTGCNPDECREEYCIDRENENVLRAKLQVYKEWEQREKEILDKANNFYNEFDLASNCTKDNKLFKRLWNKYFGARK